MTHSLLLQILFITGLINLISLIAVFLTCRCFSGNLFFKLMKYQRFRRFYNRHCYYWWVFVGSVIIHSILAIYLIGIPF